MLHESPQNGSAEAMEKNATIVLSETLELHRNCSVSRSPHLQGQFHSKLPGAV